MARCHHCGHPNSPGITFCTRCATELGATQTKLAKARQIFLPPQEDHIISPRSIKRPDRSSASGAGWVLVGLLLTVAVLIWLYGR
ncbi:TPA: hypothetical protein DHW58_01410 [Patescibacteria group bacterium]|nr:hypothetical protein [Patescibacteria group bacterium]HCR42487.1 hypothetical protein [Patescibacteria group bacterium]